jgi:hypothetical protein
MNTTFLIVYVVLVVTAVVLGQFRDDAPKIKSDVKFIFEKGNTSHKLLMIVLIPLTLPLTIPYSLRNIQKNRNPRH